jgi:phosphate-selective porin OprO/OprP
VLLNTATRRYANQADEWTLAANWILNPFVRLIANYTHTAFDSSVLLNGKSSDYEDVLSMRAQFDF